MASPVSFGSPGSKSSYSPSSSFSSSSSSSSPFSMNENKVDVGNKRLGKRERRRQRDALTLEEQADEIHLRLHMPTRSPSSVTTTTTYSSSVSFASSPTRTKKRPSSAPYIPGLGGSVLEAKLHHRPRARDCSRNSDWYTIWASIVQGATRYDCFRDNLQLYTNKSSTYGLSNYTGVSIRPRDYGGTGGIEYSNAGTNEPPIAYMHE